MLSFGDAILANILALIALAVTVWKILSNARERTQCRHEENLAALNEIRVEVSKLLHLDDCVDELKKEILRLRTRLHQLADALQARKRDEE